MSINVGFEDMTALNVKGADFGDVTLCSWNRAPRFRGTCHHRQGRSVNQKRQAVRGKSGLK